MRGKGSWLVIGICIAVSGLLMRNVMGDYKDLEAHAIALVCTDQPDGCPSKTAMTRMERGPLGTEFELRTSKGDTAIVHCARKYTLLGEYGCHTDHER